jgi:PAS domain S-box-containing protein
MTDFIRGQMDFIFFVYGLGFILLIPICLYLQRRPRSLLPWMWLLLFGATHGLLEWSDLVALSLGTNPVLDVVRLGLLILSFLLLVEFGRASLVRLRGRGPGRWVLAVLLGLALLGAFAGLPGLRASARYALGLVGALGASVALWLAAHSVAQGRRALQGAALCLAGYAAAAGLVVDPAPFFPASWLNTEVFLAAVGVPVQLGRGFLAAGLSFCLSLFALSSLKQEKFHRLQTWGRNLIVGTMAAIGVLVIAGWFVTQYLGHDATREIRTDQEHHRQMLQSILRDKVAEANRLVAVLAGSPGIISYLASRTLQKRDQAYAVLDRYSAVIPGGVVYVMDREGLTIASSNRLGPDSFLGKSYAFRPYFQQALQGAKGSYWALGVTSGEMGYYASFPVRNGRDEIIGVAVIKSTLSDLQGLLPPNDLSVIINTDGVVVLANQPGKGVKSLWPLSTVVQEQLSVSRQFGPGPFAPILALEPVDGGDCRFQGRPYLALRQPLPFQDWSIVILTSPNSIAVARMLGLSVTILLCLVALSLVTIFGLTIESTSRVQRSENRFRQLFGDLRDGFAVVDMSGNIVEWNPAFQAMLGYPPEELIKLFLRELTPENWQEQQARIMAEQVLPRGYSNLYEQQYRRRDGSLLPVELQIYLVQEDGEQSTNMWIFVRDLTARKQSEENLINERIFSETTIDSMPGVFYLFDEQGRFRRWNKNFEQATGYSAEEMAGMHPLDLFSSEDKKKVEEKIREVFVKGESAVEANLVSKDGNQIPYIFTGLRVSLGKTPYLIGTGIDITLRRRAEEALRKSEQKYRLLVANIPSAVFTGYADWAVDLHDDKINDLTGYSKEEFEARRLRWSDLVLAEDFNRINEIFLEALKSTRAYVREYRIRAKNGDILWLRERGRIICDPQGRIVEINGIFSDITEQHNLARDLEQLRRQQEMILNNAGDGIFGLNRQGEVTFTNPAATGMLGYDQAELLGRSMHDVVHHTRADGTENLRENCPVCVSLQIGGTRQGGDEFFWRKDGQGFPVEYVATPIMDRGQSEGTVVVFKDITEQKKAEEGRLRFSKLESLSTLTGGIAHDFNNIIAAIMGNIEMAQMDNKLGERTQKRLAQAEKGCHRAVDLTKKLLTFSKGGAPAKKPMFIGQWVNEAAQLALTGSKVKGELDIPKDLWPLEVDEAQITQVMHNIIINAQQAMPDGGAIQISAENIILKDDPELPLPSGKYVRVAFTDQGTGIPPENLARIFDPYFSTKNKGSGLGLAAAYSILKGHGGYLTVESKTGAGSTFIFYLPASDKTVQPQEAPAEELVPGQGRILVMDDEEMILDFLQQMLSQIGYEVECARDGQEAIALYEEAQRSGRTFAAVIMDLTIPGGMGGKEAIEFLLEFDPHCKAIVSSGYSDDSIMANFQKYGFSGVIAKPYKISELGKILHDVVMGKP